MRTPNILVITGHDLRHRYFAHQLNHHFPLAGILREAVPYPEPAAETEAEREAWAWFFSRRDAYEEATLAPRLTLPPCNRPPERSLPAGPFHSLEILRTIESYSPDFIAVYGTSLFGNEVLDRLAGKLFNLHLGLPQRYRGSSCNFWPVYHSDLESLGATVHRVDPGIDTGPVVAQGRIQLDPEDDEQTLAGKTLILGTRLMVQTIRDWQDNRLHLVPQKEKGRLYRMREFTPRAILEVKRMVESGALRHRLGS